MARYDGEGNGHDEKEAYGHFPHFPILFFSLIDPEIHPVGEKKKGTGIFSRGQKQESAIMEGK